MSIHFNESEIEDRIEDIFVEGKRIEAVFNIDSAAPIVYPTDIFKCSYESSVMLLLQTRPKILPSFQYESMDIAILLTLELDRKLRVGLPCQIAKFINNYQVSERIKDDFLLDARAFRRARFVNDVGFYVHEFEGALGSRQQRGKSEE